MSDTPMKVAIMQPYLFPYIGYYQLIGAVDRFVINEDAAYIKAGWINRNRLLVQRAPAYFTFPIRDKGSSRPISEVELVDSGWQSKVLKAFRQDYGAAPYFRKAADLLEHVVALDCPFIAGRAVASLRVVADYLAITTPFVSSTSYVNSDLKGQERVIDICRREDAATYINAIGGQELYDRETFAAAGIKLHFLQTRPIAYKHTAEPFVPSLSILDVIAFNPPETIREMLEQYDLV